MKIRTGANFENGNVIYPKKTVPSLNRFYSNNFQNTPEISKHFSTMLSLPKTMGKYCRQVVYLFRKDLTKALSKPLIFILCKKLFQKL